MNRHRQAAPGRVLRRASLAVAALLLIAAASAQADAEGSALARRVHDRPQGRDVSSALTMALIDRGSEPRLRRMFVYRERSPTGDAGTLIRFTEPADIRGTGLLSLERQAETRQWVYLPALERVRRIEAGRRGARFVNSDYYFEDLRERAVERDDHRVVGRETLDGSACQLLESSPLDAADSVYRKRITWIEESTALPLRIDFFEKNGERPDKRWRALRREQVQGYWTVTDSTLADLAAGHETRLTIERIRYDSGLPERLFSLQSLEDERIEEPFRP